MKNLSYLAVGLIVLSACGSKQKQEVAEETLTPAQTLIAQLNALVADSLIAFGHHDDLSYGYRWEYQPDSSDVKNVVGDYPAIVNWDLGEIEWGLPRQLDGVPFDFIRQNAAAHAARGGINTFSWHPRNPVTKGSAWDTSGDVLSAVLQPGELNDSMQIWIGTVADFIGNLRDAEGQRIPVVFRPWHEHTGSWFWWGQDLCTPEQYKDLWKMTRKVFDERGIDNVVWAYSPDKVSSLEQYMERYPGDEYVDIFGADVYYFPDAGKDYFTQMINNDLTYATQMAKERGKIAALTETGCEGLPINDWYCDVLYPAIKDYPIAYITVWRNAKHDVKPGHFYTPYPGHPAVSDFVEFYNLPRTAFLQDLPR